MTYNICLKPSSYSDLPEAYEVEQTVVGNNLFRYEHVHRKWEYGLALKLMKEFLPKSILNVGGGNSPLSTLGLELGAEVTEIDPDTPKHLFPKVKYIHETFPVAGLGKHEMVLCTSVIEHVPNDDDFFLALLDHSSKVVFITTDFHPTGSMRSLAHLRTYNLDRMERFLDKAETRGFHPIGRVDYFYEVPMVYDYTFASLALITTQHHV